MEPAEHARKKGYWYANWHMRKWRRHLQEQLQEHNAAWSSASAEVQQRFESFNVAEQPIQNTPKAAGIPGTPSMHGVKVRSGNGDIA